MDGATRIWLDDPNPIFRMGLAASLRDPRFVVVGESAGLMPAPPLEDVDVLVFDLGEEQSHGIPLRVLDLSRVRRTTRLVGLVPGGDAEAAQRSQCTVLVRSELTPEGFRDCITNVASQASPQPRQRGRSRSRWRELLRRKGALALVIGALAAGAFGPTGRAEGLSGSTVTAAPVTETVPVESDGEAADDVAVWVNSADRAASLVLGTDKRGAIEVYDLGGKRLQRLARPAGTTTTVDVRSGFALGGRTVTLVATGGRAMSFFRLDAGNRQLHEVGAENFPARGAAAGICLYRSPVTGRFFAFLADDGDVTQYELSDQGGAVDARKVRTWPLDAPAAHCVADDEAGRLFVSQASGVWRYDAEPEASPLARRQVDRAGGEHLARQVGGVALVSQPGRQGFLLASSKGDDTFAVYRRGQDHGWLGQRQVVDSAAADGCSATTGIEAVATDLGPDFPAGIFICQDARNTAPGPSGRQNFKFVRLDRFIDSASPPA